MNNKYGISLFRSFAMILVLFTAISVPLDIILADFNFKTIINNYYISVNILLYSSMSLISLFLIRWFNSDFFKRKMVIKFPLESVIAIFIFTLLHYIFNWFIFNSYSFYDYLKMMERKSLINNTVQFVIMILIAELVYNYDARKQIEAEKNKFRYLQLKNQLNPHFLFNSLNVLVGMLYVKTPDEVAKYAVQLSETCRYILNNSEEDVVVIENEIKFIEDFINVLNERMDGSIILNTSIRNDLKNDRILLLSFQSLVENAVKHNVCTRDKPLKIDIVSVSDDVLRISNNRQPGKLSDDVKTGIGLKNLSERYKAIGKKGVRIEENENTFSVYIPIIKNKK